MIGFFPDPYPDELLYSACARFGDRSNYQNVEIVGRELFGSPSGVAIVPFPNRLTHFISVLPPGHKYTIDRLIDEHTLLPFYSAFTDCARVEIIRSEMEAEQENRIVSRLGISACRLRSPAALRYCPECVNADRQTYGETYWHRVHQLSGVDVCADHSVFLKMSNAVRRERGNSSAFVSAECAIDNVESRPIDLGDRQNTILTKIAKDAQWLLNYRGMPLSSAVVRNRYYDLLLRKGLAYYNGRFHYSELMRAFRDFYPESLLKRLHSEIGEQNQPWPRRIIRRSRIEIAQPPLRHLLLLTFLECSAEQFFAEFENYRPFGNGPWPCLNRASSHFNELTVGTCRITNGQKKIKGRPVGHFSCDCGFRYLRVGPDLDQSDRMRFNKVISYGAVWEEYFEQCWKDSSVTLTALGKELNLIPFSLRRHAIRLKLRFPRKGRWARPTSEKVIKEWSNARLTFEESMEDRRRQWLTVRKRNPKASRQELIRLAPYHYYWLNRHSPEWLLQNSPAAQINNPDPIRVDWKHWDLELSKTIGHLSKQIRESAGRPIRVSKEEIIHRLGHRSWFELSLDKLPKTSWALKRCLESREDFLIRRVDFARKHFMKEGIYPTRHQFDVRAGTRTKNGDAPQVQKAIEIALANLQV